MEDFMAQFQAEGCLVCKSIVAESRPNPICQIQTCNKRTCHNCQRVCDLCLQTVCMKHIRLKDFNLEGRKSMFKACDNCQKIKFSWAGS